MKRLLYIWPLLMVVSITACEGPHQDAGEVANVFFQAMEANDLKAAKGYCTKAGKAELTHLEEDLQAFDFQLSDTFFVFQLPTDVARDTMVVEYAIDSLTLARPYQLNLVRSSADRWFVNYERTDVVGIARYFLTAFYDGNFAQARQYVMDNSISDLEYLEELYSGWTGPEVTITGVGFNNQGDKALVMYKEAGERQEKKLNLVRQNGHWKVAMSKSTSL